MTVWFETESSFHIGARAELLPDDREIASSHWAAQHIVPNPANAYVVGRYAESAKANNNRQMFALEGLIMGKPTLQHAPVNVNHSQRRVVGAFVASEIIYPTAVPAEGETQAEAAAAIPDDQLNPFMESLAVVWKHYFPDEYRAIAMAQAEGSLYYSMETVPERIQCAGDSGCGGEFAYEGPKSKSYCAHLNESASDKLLIDPHFIGGALIIPPLRPGWSHANIKALDAGAKERLEAQYAEEFSHLTGAEWQMMMGEVLAFAQSKTV